MPTGKITEWNRDRGFGYVTHEGQPLFVHIHEFAERTGTPVKGDIISFAVGVDRDGRPCAVKAVYRAGGRLKFWHLLFLAVLLAAPGYALYRGLNLEMLRYVAGGGAILSVITFLVYFWDKRQARAAGQRGPEALLHLLELLGGWPGAWIAQRRLRHKSSKISYQFVFWLIVALHEFVAVDFLRGWAMMQLVIVRLHAL